MHTLRIELNNDHHHQRNELAMDITRVIEQIDGKKKSTPNE